MTIAILDSDFCIDVGELTPTLKVRRRTIEEKFQSRASIKINL